ncbi:unnamed protein product [Miscanthus lutarioriparius]|uniref:Uncharacterized protein n=1 Tax=Miscanthus lutarioriparius TaxID=422564 RepID=A0A811RVI6_9POAL|nr:unnamed protein product [Miscanthus lutarioriparius]
MVTAIAGGGVPAVVTKHRRRLCVLRSASDCSSTTGRPLNGGRDKRRNQDSQIPRGNVVMCLHLLCHLHHAACSSPPPRAPHLALGTATVLVRKGTFRSEEAHDLFDELLRQATHVPGRELNGFLAVLARAPASAAYRDGPALAVALFNRAYRAHGTPMASSWTAAPAHTAQS